MSTLSKFHAHLIKKDTIGTTTNKLGGMQYT